MASNFGRGARAAGASVGTMAAAALGGAAAAAVLAAGATQVAQDLTQPNETAANVSNVNQPSYAD
jgi:hypothetical protein